jgi:hypothetical protein
MNYAALTNKQLADRGCERLTAQCKGKGHLHIFIKKATESDVHMVDRSPKNEVAITHALLSFCLGFGFLWRFCAFLNKGFKNTAGPFWRKSMSKTVYKKVEGTFFSPLTCHSPPSVQFYRVFPVSLHAAHEEPKTQFKWD